MNLKQRLKEEQISSNLYYQTKGEHPNATVEEIIAFAKKKVRPKHTLYGKRCTVAEAAKQLGIHQLSLARVMRNKKMSLEQAYEDVLSRQGLVWNKKMKTWQKPTLYIDPEDGKEKVVSQIAKNHGVSESALRERMLNQQPVEEAIKEIKPLCLSSGETLVHYCAKMGYNYRVINRILKNSSHLSVEEAIEQYILEGQTSVGIPTDLVGKVVLRHFLLHHGISPMTADVYLNQNVPIHEVITKSVFVQKNDDYAQKIGKKLYFISQVIEPLSERMDQEELLDKLGLETQEKEWLLTRIDRIRSIKREYFLLSVATTLETLSLEEQVTFAKENSITKEELLHIISGEIYRDYTPISTKKGQMVYIKQPKKIDKK